MQLAFLFVLGVGDFMQEGNLVFVNDDFFNLVNDLYLKINKGKGHSRLHYFAFKMRDYDDMYWVVPMTSRVRKFNKIVENKKAKNRPTDIFLKTTVRGKERYMLFGDMFPVHRRYISEYHSHKQVVKINYKDIPKAHKEAEKVIGLLNRGIKFTQTSPDVKRIIEVQIEHEKKLKAESENDVMKNLQDFVEKYHIKMPNNEQNQGRKL